MLLNTEATAKSFTDLVPAVELFLLEETGNVVIGQTGRILKFFKK